MLINKIKIDNISDGYVNIPLSSDFSLETRQYDYLESNLKSDNDIINEIIDYEKVKLYPIDDDDNICDALNFSLHFFINNNWDLNTTKLSDIGFEKEDVENKRKRLKKSFIRLLFYDSIDLKKQNLLYYSNIFINIDDLYTTYIRGNLSMNNLLMNFFVENSKLSKKIKSFEGFNIYLFKDDIPKNDIKTIYMRVDFNNAMDGRSVLFTKGKPDTINGYSMQELNNNIYYEMECSYNSNMNKYVYKIKGKNKQTHSDIEDKYIKNKINIDLYQAKVK